MRIGDPATQTALELSGMIDELSFKPEWANISGGPQTLEAFRADALDVGAVADIPPLFAQWTGTDIKIVAARFSEDPIDHPIYELERYDRAREFVDVVSKLWDSWED